ncbi:MAG: PAS domain-containing protein [bacterium]
MVHDHSHADLLEELTNHFQPVLDECPEGVYLWLGDRETVCNDRFADLLGITPKEWADEPDILGRFMAPEDQERFAGNFAKAVGHLQGPVRFKFTGIRKDGKKVALETDMIPITFGGHAVAYHFVRPAK